MNIASSALPCFAEDFENITKEKPDFLCRKASNYSDISSAGVAVPTDLLSFHKLSELELDTGSCNFEESSVDLIPRFCVKVERTSENFSECVVCRDKLK